MHKEGIDPYYWSVTNQYGHGHWNEKAYVIIADEIAKQMVNIINSHLFCAMRLPNFKNESKQIDDL